MSNLLKKQNNLGAGALRPSPDDASIRILYGLGVGHYWERLDSGDSLGVEDITFLLQEAPLAAVLKLAQQRRARFPITRSLPVIVAPLVELLSVEDRETIADSVAQWLRLVTFSKPLIILDDFEDHHEQANLGAVFSALLRVKPEARMLVRMSDTGLATADVWERNSLLKSIRNLVLPKELIFEFPTVRSARQFHVAASDIAAGLMVKSDGSEYLQNDRGALCGELFEIGELYSEGIPLSGWMYRWTRGDRAEEAVACVRAVALVAALYPSLSSLGVVGECPGELCPLLRDIGANFFGYGAADAATATNEQLPEIRHLRQLVEQVREQCG